MDNNLIYVFKYGSQVYGTKNNMSDVDVICIVKEKNKTLHSTINKLVLENLNQKHIKIDINEYSEEEFLIALGNCEISFLECMFLEDKDVIYKSKNLPEVKIDLSVLRESISKKASNSWVKAKKKLIVEEDYDVNIAQKSLFHSLRILDFGIQIAKNNKIIDYSSSNFLLDEIKSLEVSWEVWNQNYKNTYNQLSSDFRSFAPKKIKP